MTNTTILLLLANLGLLIVLLVRRQAPAEATQTMTLLQGMQDSIRGQHAEMQRQLVDSLNVMHQGSGRMQEGIRQQHGEALRLANEIRASIDRQITEVAREVSASKGSTEQVLQLAEQLKNLERVLKHQKQRGSLGERSLELILSNMLPPGAYRMQHQFSGGDIVDAVIMAREGLIPIDAKFPLDNYVRLLDEADDDTRAQLERAFRNDLKARIDEVAKYVRADTLPFALMFVPAEGVYYDLLVNEIGAKGSARNLVDYAIHEKRVIIVSPSTFAAYLGVVLYGFKAFQIEEASKEIAGNVEKLARHLKAFEDYHKRLGATLSTTVNHYNASVREFGKIDKDVVRITGQGIDIQLETVERPQLEDGRDMA